MNLLIFVLTFLLLIASVSYQGLAHYRSNAQIRSVWSHYMRVEEPCAFNSVVKEEYRNLLLSNGKRLKKVEKEKAEAAEDEQGSGSSKINFRFLIDSEYIAKYQKEAKIMDSLLKKLIHFLYEDQIFYQTLIEKKPAILDELLAALRTANDDKKITRKQKLETIVLQDKQLQDLWHQILRENPVSEKIRSLLIGPQEDKEPIPCFNIFFVKNYLSDSNYQKIRLYLLPRALLYILLEDANAVNEIIAKRKELYSKVKKKNNPMPLPAATLEFKRFAEKFPILSNYESIILYSVTKTNPSEYD